MTTVLVTGGGGFLGQSIVRQLLSKNYQVRIFNRRYYPQLKALGVTCLTGDITSRDAMMKAAQGCHAIIHTAAKAGIWGPDHEFEAINVQGTKHVIEACRKHQIPRLVYTSSPSVVFTGHDQAGLDEQAPYPVQYDASYPRTKSLAEQLVLQANDENLATVALRPHLIWGPGDPHLAPRIIEKARKGRLRLIGDGENLVDTVYVDNAAYAHILALEKLHSESALAGHAYFITNQEPWPIRRVINGILQAAGLNSVTRRVPTWLGVALAYTCESSYRIIGSEKEPPMTSFVAKQLSSSHWFDASRSQRDLNYFPPISMVQGMARLKHYFQGKSSGKFDERSMLDLTTNPSNESSNQSLLHPS